MREWNAAVPDPRQSDSRFGSTPGVASPRQVDDLSAPAFDDRFAQVMIRHHQGTIAPATNELSAGQSTRLKTVARDVVNAEQHQITELQSIRAH